MFGIFLGFVALGTSTIRGTSTCFRQPRKDCATTGSLRACRRRLPSWPAVALTSPRSSLKVGQHFCPLFFKSNQVGIVGVDQFLSQHHPSRELSGVFR
jgi:hypothetical protein